MPRRASDKTITHRIELGLHERQKLDELLEAYERNNRIDGVTATLQAAGSALAGGGLLWAAIALAAYLTPGILQDAYDKSKNLADRAFGVVLDPLVDGIEENYVNAIYSAGRKKTEAKRRVDMFCTPGVNFDSEQCTIAQNDYEAAAEEQRQAIQAASNAPTEVKGQLAKLWDLIVPISPFYNPLD